MRIEFYKLKQDISKKLHFDITVDGISLFTEEPSPIGSHLRFTTSDIVEKVEESEKKKEVPHPDTEIYEWVSGYFMNEDICQKSKVPRKGSQSEVTTWLVQCGYFNFFWILFVIFGNINTLRIACKYSRKNFYSSLSDMLKNRRNREKFKKLLKDQYRPYKDEDDRVNTMIANSERLATTMEKIEHTEGDEYKESAEVATGLKELATTVVERI